MRIRRRIAHSLAAGIAAIAAIAATMATSSAAPAERGQRGEELRVMSFNAWLGGSKVDDALAKQVAVIRKHRVDVVGLQETAGHTARDIAGELGWDYLQTEGDLGIVSRFPILGQTGTTEAATGVRLRLDSGREMEFWTAHLGYDPYGPYEACFRRAPVYQLMRAEEESGRTPQAEEIAEELAPKVRNAHRTPVVLVGDFNSPSHLDWTWAARHLHCDHGPVEWPATKIIETAGFTDSFREAHPDPKQTPGITWSPIVRVHDGSDGPEGAPEPQDRIDFIHYAGPQLTVLDSRTVVEGDPRPEPHQRDNAWPSDHAAVLTTFRVAP
ncbi:endonuclease/exonuclease/phosphatase family protein [Streptomyces sp. YIM 98790]|uniref:endonuclease/exonuclease/phosphatase family protein n=1 Tax=Streptomyces sp. YIM 98790 TaxID=2689077 RepID=UPI0028BE46CD|nr:endonuclease/exonuclease/phosphatase family protein [Streptomyces sp. YIM 98790]